MKESDFNQKLNETLKRVNFKRATRITKDSMGEGWDFTLKYAVDFNGDIYRFSKHVTRNYTDYILDFINETELHVNILPEVFQNVENAFVERTMTDEDVLKKVFSISEDAHMDHFFYGKD